MVIRECFRCFYHIYNSRLGRWLHNCMTRNRHYRRIRSHQSLDHSYTDSPVFDMEEVRVKVVPLAKTNYSYIIQDKASLQVAVVDPGDGYYLSQLAEKEFHQDVSAILVTHKHWDHSAGMAELLSHYPQAKSYAFHSEKICDITTRVKDGDSISLGGVSVRVVHTPGHTEGSVCFFIRPTKGPPLLFTGDTLFLGGMGAFFEGTAVTIMMTIEKLLSLPEDTLVFPGHEYSETTLKFALLMEPRNPELQAKATWVEMRRRKFYCTVPSTLSEERSYNPFLRIRSPAIQTVTSTATPMRALIALQNYRIAKRSEYKNITLVRPESTPANNHSLAYLSTINGRKWAAARLCTLHLLRPRLKRRPYVCAKVHWGTASTPPRR